MTIGSTTRAVLSVLALLAACVPTGGPPDARDVSGDVWSGFNDHTLTRIDSESEFFAFADPEKSPKQLKFVVTDFAADEGSVHYYDPSFYSLHDEWYWFRLLNGESVPGIDTAPVMSMSFGSIAAVYSAFEGKTGLPLDLRWTSSGRLYSPAFYSAGLGTGKWASGRALGLGSVLYYPPDPDRVVPEAIWCFELEYVDLVEEAEVNHFFARLEATLPPSVAGQMKWLSRGSEHQAQLANAIRSGGGPYANRVLTYQELVVVGKEVPYNHGVTAGYVNLVPSGNVGAASLKKTDIVVLGTVPDDLPPVAGIVTAVPQTPLAHLNLLAKARGTPNVYVGGILADEQLKDWSDWRTPVLLKVDSEGANWQAITKEQYGIYLDKKAPPALTIPQIDIEQAPQFVPLDEGSLADVKGWIPTLGGKSAALMSFQDFPEIEVPYRPLGISIRGYHKHLSNYVPLLTSVLADSEFQSDARVRFVFFEGEEAFRKEHQGDATSLAWLDDWLVAHDEVSLLGGPVAQGGFKKLLRLKPLNEAYESALHATLTARYASLAPKQGIRFRSSSTAEDIKGFNGAGLYDSNTGYFDPKGLSDPDLQERSLVWALKKTWASYWSYEAFEEREAAGIDHLTGNMGVLVHPRFDDYAELANGVITSTLRRLATGDAIETVVNVQLGAVSVTNPDPDNPTDPEIDRITTVGDSEPSIERIQASSIGAPGGAVLSDDELLWLHGELSAMAQAWLDNENGAWPLAQQSSTLVLDFEFKKMSGLWPARASGAVGSSRLVLKQVRTLDTAIAVDASIRDEPVPRDVLSVTAKVIARRCTSESLHFTSIEFTTDPSYAYLLDHSVHPFVARVDVTFLVPPPGFSTESQPMTWNHQEWAAYEWSSTDDVRTLKLADQEADAAGFTELVVRADGTWSLTDGLESHEGEGLNCEIDPLLVGPTEYLESLLK